MGGRGRSRRTQRKHFRDGRENVWKDKKSDSQEADGINNNNENDSNGNNTNRPTHWQPFAVENAAFDEYYKEQGVVRPEEWDSFIGCLRKPLPAAFRINSSSQFCTDLRSQLEDEFMKALQTEGIDGNEGEGIKPLPWYPDNFAWMSSFSRMQLRKNKNLERFHEFLKQENEIGNITRQEAVSMVPPLFLDVHRDHFVLDMCAAPGSKTFQLLEMIHQASQVGELPNGMVIANDVDVQRCNLLIHQTKRMCTANLAVTNHEAQHFPGCRWKNNNNNNNNTTDLGVEGMTELLFDRVLCDVPCSGDGTLRKAPDIWRKWSVGMANGVHCLQLQIAMRGLSLLKVGGKMVYSTCSMNPVENEAVVSEILRKCGDSVELVDVSSELPQLLRRPGLKTWKVKDKGMWLGSHKDACKNGRSGIVASMFPSGKPYLEDETSENDDGLVTEVSCLPLERCMRIVPHDQNTGAFFIAVLHKISPLPVIQTKTSKHPRAPHSDTDEKAKQAEDDVAEKGMESDESNPTKKLKGNGETRAEKANDKRKLQIQGKWYGVDPIVLFKDDGILTNIKDFYGIRESFSFDHRLITRNSDTNHVKRIYYVSESVKNVVKLNFLSGQQLKITSIGLKMFERQTSKEGNCSPCVFRISSEGLPLLLPYMTKQIASSPPLDFKHLLQYKSVKFQDIVDDRFREKLAQLSLGCCVVVLNKDEEGASDPPKVDKTTIAIGCWKGRSSISVMVTAVDCQELLERLLIRLETGKESLPTDANEENL